MTFGEIHKDIVYGKVVSRVHWGSDQLLLRWSEGFNCFVMKTPEAETMMESLTLPQDCFFADDWIVVEEPVW
jgi:hypothetical protein